MFAKVMFLQLSIILFTGGVCLSAYWDTYPPPQEQTPHGADTPPPEQQTTPWSRLPQSRHPAWSRHPRSRPPQSRHPPSRHPPEQTPPVQCMLGDTGNKRAIRILLECILVVNMFECARIDRGGKMSSTLNKH